MTTQSASAPRTPPPQLLAVMTALRVGDFERALSAAEVGLKDANDRAPFLAFAGLAAQRLGEPGRAVEYLRELLRINPGDLATRSNLAKALIEAGDRDGAFELARGGGDGLASTNRGISSSGPWRLGRCSVGLPAGARDRAG